MASSAGRRRDVFAAVLFVVVAGVVPAVGLATTGGGQTAPGGVSCPDGGDGAVFATDGGLEVEHPGENVSDNPFVDDSTLSFPNVTVSAGGVASLEVASATADRACLVDLAPTSANLEIEPDAGPSVVVADTLLNLTYGSMAYSSGSADFAYSASGAAEITIDETVPGDGTVRAVDADDGTELDAQTVDANASPTLVLPAGTAAVDLQFTPRGTETPTSPTPASPGDDGGEGRPGGGDDGGTPVPGANGTATQTPAPNGSGAWPGGEWTSELVDYEPSSQTQHVGGFFPLAVLLWIAGLWLTVTRRDPTSRWLALVLTTAAVRATSDVLQLLLDDFAGVEAPLAGINLALELLVAVQFLQFAAVYAGEKRYTSHRARMGLAGATLFGATAILTNSMHGLVFADVRIAVEPFTYVSTTAGPGAWLVFAVNMALLLWGGWLIVRSIVGPSIVEVWKPVTVVAAGLGLALGVGVASMLDSTPAAGFDYTAAGVNYFVLMTTATLVGQGLKRLKASGQESVITDLEDAIVVLDDAWSVVEYNPAASALFPDIRAGQPFGDVLSAPLSRPPPGETITREVSLSIEADASTSEPDAAADVDAGDSTSGVVTDGGDPDRDVADLPDRPDDPDLHLSGPSDDGIRHFLVSVTSVTAETNDSIGYAVRLADVTTIKRHLVALQERNEQLDHFATAITRDLRGPLTDAAASTDEAMWLLEMADEPATLDRSRLAGYLGTVERALDRITATIEDLLGLARGERIEVDPQPVAFEQIARLAWDAIEPPGATLQVESTGTVTADPDHLRRILDQLFQNAVEHGSTNPPSQAQEDAVERGSTSPDSQARQDAGSASASEPSVADAPEDAVEQGSTSPDSQAQEDAVEHAGPDVTIRTGVTEDGFYVADDGPGVPAEIQDSVFEQGVTTSDAGAGLGLVVVRHRARAHGWSIRLDPDGSGARFEVTGCETEPREDAGGTS